MSDLRKAAEAALKLWDAPSDTPWFAQGHDAMNALRAALAAEQAQPRPDPTEPYWIAVARASEACARSPAVSAQQARDLCAAIDRLHDAIMGPAPAREPVALTDDEIAAIFEAEPHWHYPPIGSTDLQFARDIERACAEKWGHRLEEPKC